MPESLPAVLRRDLTDREQAILTHGSRGAREIMLNVEGVKNEAMAEQQLAAVRAKCASLLRPAFASVVAEANGNGNGHHRTTGDEHAGRTGDLDGAEDRPAADEREEVEASVDSGRDAALGDAPAGERDEEAPAPPSVEPESDPETDTAAPDDGLSVPEPRQWRRGELQQAFLDYVCEHEPVRQVEVAKHFGIGSPDCVRIVSQLVQRRLIEKGVLVMRSPLLSCTPGLAAGEPAHDDPPVIPERSFEEKFSGAFPADGEPPPPSPELTPPVVPPDLIGPAGDEPGDGLDVDHPNYWRQRMLDPDRPTMDMVPRSSRDGLPEDEDIGAGDVSHVFDIVQARYALALLRHIEVGHFEPELLDRFERIVGLSDSTS